MERRPTRTRTTLALSVLALTLIAPWALGQDPDAITERQIIHDGQQIRHMSAPVAGPDDQIPNIIGGTRLDPADWPFILQVWFDGDNDELGGTCTAALIHELWVLTAAHCVDEGDGTYSDIRIVVPSPVYSPDADSTISGFKAKRVIIHPDYPKHDDNAWLPDVALVELNSPISLFFGREPVRVLSPVEEERFVTLGRTAATQLGSDGPDDPARFNLYSISRTLESIYTCYDENRYLIRPDREKWGGCTAGNNIGEGGDSGGPYVVRLPNGEWGQVGVHFGVSGSEDENRSFDVFTRVSTVYDWIAQYVPLQAPLVQTSYMHFPLFVSGLSWTTEFVLMNPFETHDVDVYLEFFDGSGNRVDPLPSQSIYTVPAGGALSVELPDSQSRTLSSGSVVATAEGFIEGFSRFKVGERAWLGASGMATMEANESFRIAFSAMIGAEQTYVSVRNPRPENWVNVKMSLFSAAGNVLVEKSDIYIAPNGRYLKGLHTVFPAYKTERQQFTGTVIVEGLNDAPISSGAFQISNGDISGVPNILDWKDNWSRFADAVGRNTTVGQVLQLLGIQD